MAIKNMIAVRRLLYNVDRHYTGPERSEVAIKNMIAVSGYYIMSIDIIPARSEVAIKVD